MCTSVVIVIVIYTSSDYPLDILDGPWALKNDNHWDCTGSGFLEAAGVAASGILGEELVIPYRLANRFNSNVEKHQPARVFGLLHGSAKRAVGG